MFVANFDSADVVLVAGTLNCVRILDRNAALAVREWRTIAASTGQS